MAYIPYEYITHVRKVKSLYKLALRDMECRLFERHDQRIQMVILREEFEQNRNIRDPIKARQLLDDGLKEMSRRLQFPQFIWPTAPEGTAYNREGYPRMDWVLDYYHPLEKKQYPTYFATREKRKKEFIQWYDRKYGKQDKIDD